MKNDKKPKGMLVNRSELSYFLGIAKTTIDSYVRAGMPVFKKAEGRGKAGQFDTAAVVEWLRLERCYCDHRNGRWV